MLLLTVCVATDAQSLSISDSIDNIDNVAVEALPITSDSALVKTAEAMPVISDSLAFKAMPMKRDSIVTKKDEPESVPLYANFQPNPNTALWLALAIPGAGQIYNRKYWKLPIVYGLGVGVGYAIAYTNRNYQDYRNAYQSINSSMPNPDLYEPMIPDGYPAGSYSNYFKTQMDKFRRERDISIVAAVVVYALSVIDAFVDAQLSDFDVSPDLSIKVAPEVQQVNHHQAVGMGVGVKF